MSVKLLRAEAKPFVKWAGGKGQLLNQLEKYYPEQLLRGEIKRYIEPFVGGGAVLFEIAQKYDSIDEFYIFDINSDLINSYLVIKNKMGELVEFLKDIESEYLESEQEKRNEMYYNIREKYNLLTNDNGISEKNMDVVRAGYFIFLNRTCFNGLYRVNKSGLFNVPKGDYRNPTICDEDNLYLLNEILQKVEIFNKSYHEAHNYVSEDTFVYLDPPYRPLSDSSSFTAYSKVDFDDDCQKELADLYRKMDDLGGLLMLSNSDPKNINENDNFFDDLYYGYKINRVLASRIINSNASGRGKITEIVVTN